MPSAFLVYQNATIELATENGYILDGFNEVPNIVIVNLAAHLKQEKTPSPFQVGGVDSYLANYTGYLIDRPPNNYIQPQEVTVNLMGLGIARFIMVRMMPSPFYDEVDVLGTPIALLSRVA